MSAMAFRAAGTRRAVHLSVTPLIDVLFLLIIFFVLTGTFRRFGQLELSLPDSTTAAETPDLDEANEIELAITETGQLYLDEMLLPREELPRALRRLRGERPDARVLVNAEAHVDHADVVALLDAVRDAGFPGVGIGTRLARDAEPATQP